MQNILDLVNILSSSSNKINDKEENKQEISKELNDMYPYGKFPIRYTKNGQETIRKQSENRFLNIEENKKTEENKMNFSDLGNLLPLIQIMSSGKKKDNNQMFELLSKILFKDNPELQKLLKLFPHTNNKEIKPKTEFPETNTISISSLKKIN